MAALLGVMQHCFLKLLLANLADEEEGGSWRKYCVPVGMVFLKCSEYEDLIKIQIEIQYCTGILFSS